MPGADQVWLQLADSPDAADRLFRILPIAAALFAAERHTVQISEELANRYEEIDLLYAISETLGRTLRLEEAAQRIVRDVSDVVGASRASIMVYDEESDELRTVAARGFNTDPVVPVDAGDDASVAAQTKPFKHLICRLLVGLERFLEGANREIGSPHAVVLKGEQQRRPRVALVASSSLEYDRLKCGASPAPLYSATL